MGFKFTVSSRQTYNGVAVLYLCVFMCANAGIILSPIKEGSDIGVTIMAGAYLYDYQYLALGKFLFK